MALKWKEKYEVGVDLIDEQHKGIFDRANDMLKASQEQRGKEEVEEMLAFLANYIKKHFAEEEKVQQKYDYPDYGRHKDIHEDFVAKVLDFKEEVENDGLTTTAVMKLNKMVTRWLINHIKREDQKLAKHIKDQEE